MDSLADWASSYLAVEVFTGVVVQATIILAVAWLATTLLARASAALRHGVWSLALAGLLMLPALSVLLPSWNVGLPEGLQSLFVHPRAAEGPPAAAPGMLPAAERPAETPHQPVVVESSGEGLLDAPGRMPPDAGRAIAPASATPLGLPGPFCIVLIWGVGALMLLGRLLLHAMRLWVLARHAERLADARRLAEVRHLAHRLGIRRQVRVLCSPDVSMAMTWGLWRPVVLLPYQARLWSDDRRRVVLLHELAHVKRWDYLIHLLTQGARACYWFNPLVWVAARRIHVEQERACDDEVLQAGARACEYATHLVDIARSFLKHPTALPGGMAVVRGSPLKERIWAILHAPNRHALSLKSGLAAACIGVCLILPVAALQLSAPALDPAAAPPVASASHTEDALPPRAGPATHTLTAELPPDDPASRLDAARAAEQREDRPALDRLEALLYDTCADVRAAAVRAMERLGPHHALARLPVALDDQNVQVRKTAARVLGKTLRALHADGSPHAQRALQDHLRSAVEALVAALSDANPTVRQRVAYALGEARDEAATGALKAALADDDAQVRLAASRALGKIEPTVRFNPLIDMTTRQRAPALLACGLILFILAPSSCAQNKRWAQRDKWQKVPAIFEAMAFQPGSHVADVGSREGYLTVRLAEAVGAEGRVYAVDIDGDALKKLHKTLAAEDTSRVRLIHSQPDDPMLPEGTLDAVVVVNAYHEFEAYAAMLQHIKAALKPGGRLVLVEPISEGRRVAMREVQESHHELGLNYAQADLEAAGFDLLDARDSFITRNDNGDMMWLLVGRRPMVSHTP